MKTSKITQSEKSNLSEQKVNRQLVRVSSSRYLLCLVCIFHLFAVVCIFISSMPFWLSFNLIVMIFCSLAYYCHSWQSMSSYRLQKREAGQWCLTRLNGEQLEIDSCYYWSSFIVILKVTRKDGRRLYYPILRDSCDEDSFRSLRVIAKYFL